MQFATLPQSVELALHPRRTAAEDVGAAPDGISSHRIAVQRDAGSLTEPRTG